MTDEKNIYLLEDEEKLLKYISPSRYVMDGIKKQKINAVFLVNYMQKELHELLNSFLNGGFSLKGFILYPLAKGISAHNKKRLEMVLCIADYLKRRKYDFSNSTEHLNGKKIDSCNFAAILSSLYRDFGLIKKPNARLKTKNRVKEFNPGRNQHDISYIQPLIDLKSYVNRNLKKELLAFYLHGSFATNDYIKGWSDVDTYAVVRREAVENPGTLLKMRDRFYIQRKFFCSMDSLQHHGCMIVAEHDLDYYPETFFPIAAMNYAKTMLGPDGIDAIKVRPSSCEGISTFFWFVHYFRKLHIEKNYRMDSYSAKFLLHCITLFPTLYLQAKGINLYKKHSFEAAKRDFKKELWEPIGKAGEIRKNWKPVKVLPFVKNLAAINPLLWYQVNSSLSNAAKSNNIDIRKLVDEMHKTSDYAWSKIKKGLKQ